MPSRVLAVFLALVLLWSGFTTFEAPHAAATVLAEVEGQPAPAGSIEQHHLDDLPAQAQAEPMPELPALLATPPTMHDAAGTAGRPAGVLRAARSAPWLDGPLRPPRRAA